VTSYQSSVNELLIINAYLIQFYFIQWMLQNFCEFSTDYTSLLRRLKDPLELKASEKIIQFPFVINVQEEKSDAELARLAERRREQGKKLQEMQVKMRAEKVWLNYRLTHIHILSTLLRAVSPKGRRSSSSFGIEGKPDHR
jgi:actin-related protein 5